MTKTLKDFEGSFWTFLGEAAICAKTPSKNGEGVLGFAAMSLALSCVISVGEALCRHRRNNPDGRISDLESVDEFCREWSRDWVLRPSNKKFDESAVPSYLHNLRNAIVHTIALPEGIILFPSKSKVQMDILNMYTCGIAVDLFIDRVKDKITALIASKPDLVFDFSTSSVPRYPAFVIWNSASAGQSTGGSISGVEVPQPRPGERTSFEIGGTRYVISCGS